MAFKSLKICLFYLLLVSVLVYVKSDNDKFSFTLVIDNTNSMTNDIAAVKIVSRQILDTVLKTGSTLIENYVLVTFNDPFINKTIVTTDAEEYKRRLNAIDIERHSMNPDCPELSLTGLEAALNQSLKHSTVYLFTDDRAKDAYLTDKVRNLAIRKQCKLLFIVTKSLADYCIGPIDATYYTLAKATNGFVFRASKSEVEEILNFAKESVKTKRKYITSAEFPPGYGNKMNVSADQTMKDLMVSIGGDVPKLNVTKPDGDKANTSSVIDTSKSKVVKVEVEEPGEYELTLGSTSNTSVLVEADTDFDFIHGFSLNIPHSIVGTSLLPLPDVKSYLVIQVNSKDNITLHSVELSDRDDNVIMDLPLVKLGAVYVTKVGFLPPKGLFQITVSGVHVKSNKMIKRTSPTPIEVQDVDLVAKENKYPTMTIDKGLHVKAEYDEPLTIDCIVNAYPEPKITWYDGNGNVVASEVTMVDMPYDYKNNLIIKKVNTNATYKCEAVNSYGKVHQIIRIETKRKFYFNILLRPKDTKIEYKKEGHVKCKIDSYPPAEITWYKDDKLIVDNANIEISSNGTELYVKHMTPEQNGTYSCKAENGLNSTALYFNLIITGSAPTVIIKEGTQAVVEYDAPVNLQCLVTGYPAPLIVWKEKNTGNVLPSTTITKMDKESDYISLLHIKQMTRNITYQCSASNDQGENSVNIEIETRVYIDIIEQPKDLNVEIKKDGTVRCKVDAKPPATLSWYKDGVRLLANNDLDITYATDGSSVLMISEMKPHLVGNYACRAANDFQTMDFNFNVSIKETAPKTMIEGAPKINATYAAPLQVLCKVTGYPEPDIIWLNKKTGEEPEMSLASVDKPYDYGRAIQIRKVTINETYTCKAKNSIGEHSTDVAIETVRTHFFDIVEIPKDTRIKYKESGQAFCKVSANPPAEIIWYKGGKILKTNSYKHISINQSTISITNMQPELAGTYKCEAKNSDNITTLSFQISITGMIPPSIQKRPEYQYLTALEGTKVNFICRLDGGDPTPKITWRFRAEAETKRTELKETGEEFTIDKVTRDKAGVYSCQARNAGGRDNFHIYLTVEYAPSIKRRNKKKITLQEGGENYILYCDTSGVPNPDVEWFQNNSPVDSAEYKIFHDHSILIQPSSRNVGEFTCLAKNLHGESNMTINVNYVAPVVIDPPDKYRIEVREGDPVEMACEADGYPRPKIQWKFLGLNSTSPPKLLKDAMSPDILKIMTAEPYRSGFYICDASNWISSSNISYEVIVNAPPRIISPSGAFTKDERDIETLTVPSKWNILFAVKGDSYLRIPCAATGFPKPEIKWINSENLLASGTKWYETADDGALLIKDIDKSGVYKCKAVNKLGSDEATFEVIVEDSPRITSPSRTMTINYGDSVNIKCDLPHTPFDQVRWFKDGIMLKGRELTLSDVNWSDSDVYTCRVCTLSSSQSSTITIEVIQTTNNFLSSLSPAVFF